MSEWSNFYVLLGTTAATLIGLMFVAITFGSKLITAETLGPAKTILSPIIFHFTHILFLACAVLIPFNGTLIVAASTIVLAIVRSLYIPKLIQELKKTKQLGHEIETSDWIYGVYVPLILYILFIIGGIALFIEHDSGLFIIGFSSIALMALGIVSAWDMLVWMVSKV